ncbi:peptide deformylase [Candidatus Woesebacteria bacterium]|nr:peptide deformylase [Candidatus Woesebacteria bacterium]
MTQPIISVPHETLRKKSILVEKITPAIQEMIRELKETMVDAHEPEGVGLSLPQIGYNVRGFVTYLDKKLKIYLNPIILDMSEETTLGGTPERPTLEGCLSIPWLYGPVWRPKKIKVQAIDEHGAEFSKTFTSFPARLFMHEYDHLDGVLFTDYTLRDGLPLYLLDHNADKFVQIDTSSEVIKW